MTVFGVVRQPLKHGIKMAGLFTGIDGGTVEIVKGMGEIGHGGSNKAEMTVWHADDNSEPRFTFRTGVYTPRDSIWHSTMARPWYQWLSSDGKQGVEPPEEIKELASWVDKMRSAVDPKERIEWGKKILRYQAEHIMSIGIARIPKPVVKNKYLANVPEKATTGWDYMGPAFVYPQQYYFRAPRNQQ